MVPGDPGRHFARVENCMEQRSLLPECAIWTKNVYCGRRRRQETGQCVSDVWLDRLLLRGPDVPAASELQPNDRTNVSTEAVYILRQTERVGEQEALPIIVERILADLPVRFTENLAKGGFKVFEDGAVNAACQLIQFPVMSAPPFR